MIIANKEKIFNSLLASVNKCDICPRMCNRKKVLSDLNGNINSKVVFIAEAPGRLGAECTGIPLYGDITGNNFETLLSNIGWNRDEVFITNAILCNPQDENGNNATPTKEEICNCSYYLNMILELIEPEVIVTLGAKALEALNNIENHKYTLKQNVATLVSWRGTKIFPMYHMSPRAAIHRSLTQQRTDFIALSHEVSPQTGLKKNQGKNNQNKNFDTSKQAKLSAMAEYIVYYLRDLSFFKLTKLLYLIDFKHLDKFQTTISNSIYLRMQEGPWIPYLKNVIQESKNIKTIQQNGKPALIYSSDNSYFNLTDKEIDFINELLDELKDATDSEIKTKVYLTKPMKYILRKEKKGEMMLKTPVLYKNKTVEELNSTLKNDE